VAGAAGGMAATFAAPVAAVLLAVELLLFEWKPRSAIPVALASVAATVLRRSLLGVGPIFPVPPHTLALDPLGLLASALVGILAGALSAILTALVYGFEDAFHRLPLHWMWWPTIGGLAIGIGGLIFPRALGVGYDTIGGLLAGTLTGKMLIGILLVKALIWAISLGSGTSGGVLAPLLMMGGALGGLEALVLPNQGPGFWPLISMGAILGGTMRSPFTGIIFTLELTHDINALLPLTLAVFVAHGFTVLTLRRSILTEKISRRGYHLSREYAIDPLEILFAREVMRTNVVAVPDNAALAALAQTLHGPREAAHIRHGQHLYPVVDATGTLKGVLTRRDIRRASASDSQVPSPGTRHAALLLADLIEADPVVAYPDEPLRIIVDRMAETGLTQFPVIARSDRRLVGLVSLRDLLRARERNWAEERQRERVFRLRRFVPARAPEPEPAEIR
jgi:CIC family chloride channel protein